jgi:undecaprenyl-diphosphatase
LSALEAIILGIIQGLTEFLPVSSSGHLELAKAILGDQSLPEESLLFTVVLHFATALSTIVIFRKEIAEIFTGLLQFKWNEQAEFSVKIILSMIPAAVIGVLFNDQIEALFSRQILLVGAMLILTGLLLFLADRAKNTNKKVTYSSALLIGISQAIAILPGISRSGATISTSVLLGIDRERAARFSFLMVVPLILGKMAKDLLDGGIAKSQMEILPLVLGALAAFISGLIACQWMISLVKKSQLKYFSFYCLIVGTIAILISL